MKDMKWIKIDRDKNGFATEECLDKIFNNLPCAVCSQTKGGYKYYNFVNEYLDMCHNRKDIRTKTGYTHYLPVPKLESMSNIKDLIKEKLNQLSKEDLVDALADVCAIYVSANITTQLSSANNIQQCINNVQTNLQQVDNVLTQRLNINFKKL